MSRHYVWRQIDDLVKHDDLFARLSHPRWTQAYLAWHYENSQIESTATYQSGIKQGEQTFYDEQGKVKKVEVYKDNELVETRVTG